MKYWDKENYYGEPCRFMELGNVELSPKDYEKAWEGSNLPPRLVIRNFAPHLTGLLRSKPAGHRLVIITSAHIPEQSVDEIYYRPQSLDNYYEVSSKLLDMCLSLKVQLNLDGSIPIEDIKKYLEASHTTDVCGYIPYVEGYAVWIVSTYLQKRFGLIQIKYPELKFLLNRYYMRGEEYYGE